ncbi:MAG: hypothetical protein WCI88_07490, partial [Chloroflexota bacterium]
SPTFKWNVVSNSASYFLQVDGSGGNVIRKWYTREQAGCNSGTGECSVLSPVTLGLGNYTWKVETWNSAGGYGAWSSQASFTIQ